MKNEINENDIKNLTFAFAPFNMSDKWQHELQDNLIDAKQKAMITFMTTTGTYSVKACIEAVIENYLHTDNNVIIPLNSITDISFKKTTTDSDFSRGYHIMIFIVIIILLAFIIFITLINGHKSYGTTYVKPIDSTNRLK